MWIFADLEQISFLKVYSLRMPDAYDEITTIIVILIKCFDVFC